MLAFSHGRFSLSDSASALRKGALAWALFDLSIKEPAMLVLTRKIGETILVPSHGMSIQVISVKGRRVRLGIVAPRDTKVVREEIMRDDHEDQGDHEDHDHHDVVASNAVRPMASVAASR